MKTLLAVSALGAALALAGPVSAQTLNPMTMQPAPSWMQDDGSSSDYPIHMKGDISGDRLNAEYSGGLYTAPGTGLPALPGQGE